MTDFIMLVCAVLAALTAGVLAAYGVCITLFTIFRMSASRPAEDVTVRVPAAATIVEG